MKNFLFFLGVILLSAFTYQSIPTEDATSINWMSLEEAQALVKTNPKPILVDVYAPWCKPCKKMLSETLTNPKVIKHVNKKYYAVKFKAETSHEVTFNGKSYSNPNFDYEKGETGWNTPNELTKYWDIKGYPTLVILDANLSVKEKLPGMKTATDLVKELKKIDKRVAVIND